MKVCVVDAIGYRVHVSQIRLPISEPDFISFINIQGSDMDLEVSTVSLPAGQGFRNVDFSERYCYLQNQRVFTGRYRRVGSVGMWHQTMGQISFESDGDGVLGGQC